MWTVTLGNVSTVSVANVNRSLRVLDSALEYWSRYIDFGTATLDIRINITPLDEKTLGQATTFYSATSGGVLQAISILELQTGVDQNGSAADFEIDINADVINAGAFAFVRKIDSGIDFGFFDLFSVLTHEIAHGLGFGSLDSLSETSVFDSFIIGLPDSPKFSGPISTALQEGGISLDEDLNHLGGEFAGFLLGPDLIAGTRRFLSQFEISILQDIGLPILKPTNSSDILYGFPQADEVDLLDGNDIYFGFDGDDYIDGGRGDDTLSGGNGINTLVGGEGDDVFIAGARSESFDGGHGFDILENSGDGAHSVVDLARDFTGRSIFRSVEGVIGGRSSERLFGDSEDNLISGRQGNDFLAGRAGDDILAGGIHADTLDGGDGVDTASYLEADEGVTVRLWAGDGTKGEARNDELRNIENLYGSVHNDVLSGDDNDNRIDGNLGDDILQSLGGDDTVWGDDGNDLIFTGFGDDRSEGGSGNDFVRSGPGKDTILGGSGDDTLGASNKADLLRGGDGADLLLGSNGNDRLFGDGGNDTLLGGNGQDTLNGGAGADLLIGNDNNDTASYASAGAGVQVRLWNGDGVKGEAVGDQLLEIESLAGSAFNDTLTGDVGANRIDGNLGADFIQGLDGDDQLIGDRGDDTLTGGAGNDTFLYVNGDGADVIADFQPGAGSDDAIRLLNLGAAFDTFAELLAATSGDGAGNAVIDFGGGDTITLTGVSIAQLHEDDFIFG